MALLTQKVILTTFEEMLQEMPFDKITIAALVKRCSVSSNTFYYHYQDIYALLDTWLSKKLDDVCAPVKDTGDWTIKAKAILLACQQNSKIIEHILCSLSREQMEQYIFTHTEDVINRVVNDKAKGKNLSETQISTIAAFCRYSFVGMFLKKNWDHFSGDVEAEVDQMGILFNTFVDSAAEAMGTHDQTGLQGRS